MKKAIIAAGCAVIIALLFFHYCAKSSFYIVDTFDILLKKLPLLNHDTLVIFDIDKVVVIETDPWERGHRDERKKSRTVAALFQEGSELYHELDKQQRDRLWSIYAQGLAEQLLDANIAGIIATLQSKSVKVIALTRFLVGKIGAINALEDLRIDRMKTMGIDLSSAFPHQEPIIFKQFSYEGRSPIFKEGFLFTTLACSKGDLLKAFFEAIGWYPQRVLMFDDKVANLQSVQEALALLHIPFEGFEYTGSAKIPMYFDKTIAEFQMQYLIDHEEWISADQARKMMENSQNYSSSTISGYF